MWTVMCVCVRAVGTDMYVCVRGVGTVMCVCVRGVDFASVSRNFRVKFGSIPKVVFLCFSLYQIFRLIKYCLF
jgi:hypothetical protein